MIRYLLTLGLACVLTGPLLAQVPVSDSGAEVHRLEVRGGVIYHDGAALPSNAVPDDVDLRGFPPVAMDYQRGETPAIEVDGRVFAFKNNRLVEVPNAVSEDEAAQGFAVWQPRSLGQSAVEEQASRRQQAEQEYLDSLSENDRALYEQLVRERNMEQEAVRLAQAYRQATSEAERARIQQQLREKLGAMFDLKQENRLDEVRQMEEALESLRQRMDERRDMRDQIIEHRLNELLGQ